MEAYNKKPKDTRTGLHRSEDDAVRQAFGLARCVCSRRMCEWFSKLQPRHVASLQAMSFAVAKRIAPTVIRAQVERFGYMPLFWDGTAIEVYGKNFKQAADLR